MQVEIENHAVAKSKVYIYSLKTNNLGRSVPHKRPACPLKNNFVSWNYTLKAIFLVNLYYVEITLVTEKGGRKNKVRDKIAHLTIYTKSKPNQLRIVVKSCIPPFQLRDAFAHILPIAK